MRNYSSFSESINGLYIKNKQLIANNTFICNTGSYGFFILTIIRPNLGPLTSLEYFDISQLIDSVLDLETVKFSQKHLTESDRFT